MKFIKFEIAKRSINSIIEEYKVAKENDDEKLMEQLQEEYKGFRTLLWSSYNYIKGVNAAELYLETKEENVDEYKKTQNEILLGQRTLYLSNRVYVNNVEKSEDIEKFMKKDNKKALNFVKKHCGKFALGVAAAATLMTLGLTGCHSQGKDKEEANTQTTTETTISTTTEKDTKTTEKETKTTENVVVETEKGYVKLNELPEFEDTNTYVSESEKEDKKGNNKNVDENSNKDGAEFTYKNKPFEKKVVTEELDPHVTNDDSGKKTTTTVEKEKPAKEPEAVDYPTKVTDKTKKNKEEKVTVTEKDEKKKVKTENLPIDGAKEEDPVDYKPEHKDEDFIPSEEKVTIIEKEEKQEIDKNIPVEENGTIIVKEETEKVTYEETEETIPVNTDNLPIVEGKAKTLAYRM